MAINIKNYVDISTTFPSANVGGRSFGGLVFTATSMIEPSAEMGADIREAYTTFQGLGVTYLTLAETKMLFGETSDEYKFAAAYYGYVSPSGRFASRLAFSKTAKGATENPLLDSFKRVNDITNLFGSFTFLSAPSGEESAVTLAESADLANLVAVSEYNASLDAKYLFVVNRVRGTEDATVVTGECHQFEDYAGTVFVSGGSSVSAYMPMAILGATDYTDGQVVNFMFKQFEQYNEKTGTGEKPVVEDDQTYYQFNKSCVNFYGRTQTNGQTIDFYQRGFNTDGIDTAVYCNEMWFKSVCETALMKLLVSRERLPADALGVDLVKLEVVDCCAQGIRNGMFMQKEPTRSDVRGIREIVVTSGGADTEVGSIEADISTKGYSVYAYLSAIMDADKEPKIGRDPEKTIEYYVFYGTADSVRYIKGNDILLK